MKVYICTDHDSHYPVGCCSIVTAPDEATARGMLDLELWEAGLDPKKPFTLREIDLSQPRAEVLLDGTY